MSQSSYKSDRGHAPSPNSSVLWYGALFSSLAPAMGGIKKEFDDTDEAAIDQTIASQGLSPSEIDHGTKEKIKNQVIEMIGPPVENDWWGIFTTKLSSILTTMSIVGAALLWLSTFKAAKDLFTAQNRNASLWAKFFISLLTSIIMTAVSTGALLKAAPFILMGILGLNAALGLFNFIKNIYLAYQDRDNKELRNQHIWNAFKELVSIVTNTLAMVASYFVGVKLLESKNMIETIPNESPARAEEVKNAKKTFEKGAKLIKIMGLTIFAFFILDLGRKLINWCRGRKNSHVIQDATPSLTPATNGTSAPATAIDKKDSAEMSSLKKDCAKHMEDLALRITRISCNHGENAKEKNKYKLLFNIHRRLNTLTELPKEDSKEESIEAIITKATRPTTYFRGRLRGYAEVTPTSNVFSSFWGEKTQRLAERALELERKMVPRKGAAA